MRVRGFRPWLALMIAASVAKVGASLVVAGTTNSVLTRAVSASGQFTAYARDPLVPSILCVFAERVKHECLAQLRLLDKWRDPIVILVDEWNASSAARPAISVDAVQNEIHFKYQISCIVPPRLEAESLRVAMVQALCDEFSNRDQPTLQTRAYRRAMIPPWLVMGLAETFGDRTDSLLETARRSVNAGRPATASELIGTMTVSSDPMELELFRANAWMLTEGLLSLPSGPEKMQLFLTALGATKSVSNAFSFAYGADFPQEVTLAKWWSIQQAQCAVAILAQNLSLDETTHRLNAILSTVLVEDDRKKGTKSREQVSMDKLWHSYEKPWLRGVLEKKLNSLELLRSEAHPFYRSVIDGYAEAVALLMNGKISRYRRAVAAADRARAAADQTAKQITAYLDQEEQIHSQGEFTNLLSGYFQTLDQIQAAEKNRHDPISNYLDQFDK